MIPNFNDRFCFLLYHLHHSLLIEKSKAIAKSEGIEIPTTLDEYTKRFHKKLPKVSMDNLENFLIDDDDDDDADNYSQTSIDNTSLKLIRNSEIKIAIKSTIKHDHKNNNDYDILL